MKGLRIRDNEVYLTCYHCNEEYEMVQVKRDTAKKDPIRCPNCGQIVGR